MTALKGLGTYGNGVGVTTPLDHKMADAGLISKTALNAVRPGLFWGGTATIVSGTAGMSYSVAAYNCVTTRGATAGVVLGGNDGTLSVATTAAPGSNSRYDVVYHWHREFSLDGTDSNPVIGVVQGDSAASPTVPSLAAFPGAIELARILVPAGVTATNTGTTITQTAPFTAVDGGKIVVRTTTERDAIVTPKADDKTYCLADLITYRYNGSAWKAWESDWFSWTPTFTNLTVGNGSLVGKRKYDCGDVVAEFDLTFGNATSVSGSVTVAPPVTAATPATLTGLAGLAFCHAGSVDAELTVVLSSGTVLTIFAKNTASTYAAITGLSSTIPGTWTTGSTLSVRQIRFAPA